MTLADDIEAAARRIERTANGRRDPTTAALADLIVQLTEHLVSRIDNLREDVDTNTEAIGYLTPMVTSHITTLADHESRLDALESP